MMYNWLMSLDGNDRIAVLGLIFGVLAWVIQALWTRLNIPGPRPEWASWKKKIVAFGISVVPGALLWYSTGDYPSGLVATAATLIGSQATHSLVNLPNNDSGGDCEKE